jgi:hypothetical protein
MNPKSGTAGVFVVSFRSAGDGPLGGRPLKFAKPVQASEIYEKTPDIRPI